MYEKLEKYFKDRTIIDEPMLKHICSYFTRVETKRNKILMKQGDVCTYYYFVNKGCLRLSTTTDDGIETTRYFAFEGAT